MRFRGLVAAVALLAALDGLTTALGLRMAGVREANPVMRALIAEAGLSGALVARVVLLGVAPAVLLGLLAGWRPQWASEAFGRTLRLGSAVVLVLAAGWWGVVVLNNAVVIAR